MRFLDLFAGIGGFRLGLEMAGHECVGHIEIDKFANQSYAAIHKPKESEVFFEDITRVTDGDIRGLRNLGIDIIAGGFPCQAFSIAGKRAGFEDTRGTLFFDLARIAREVKPKYLFLENVKGLLNHKGGDTFEIILRTLDELGYDAEWQVLNSKHFGVPQNRERVFIVGNLRGSGGRKVFPITGDGRQVDDEFEINQIGNMIDTESFGGNPQVGRVYGIDGISPCLNTMGGGGREPKIAMNINLEQPVIIGGMQKNQSVKTDGICTTLTSSMGTGGGYVPMVVARGRGGKGIAQTLTTSCNQATIIDDQGRIKDNYKQHKICPTLRAQTHGNEPKVIDGIRIRKLTPKECWRLQGFPDWAFERAKAAGVSDSQLYKQAGNSVTVNVIHEIAKRLK